HAESTRSRAFSRGARRRTKQLTPPYWTCRKRLEPLHHLWRKSEPFAMKVPTAKAEMKRALVRLVAGFGVQKLEKDRRPHLQIAEPLSGIGSVADLDGAAVSGANDVESHVPWPS